MASFVSKQVGEAKLHVSINGQENRGSPYSIVVGRNYQAPNLPNKIVNNNGGMGCPCGVALDKNRLYAVTDYTNHCPLCVSILRDDQGQLVKKLGLMGSANGHFEHPRGVVFDNVNHLYVAS